MIGLLLLTFVAGILTFLAPCTLPVLPAYFAFASSPTRTSTTVRTLAFGAGVMMVFVALGVLAGSFGSLVGAHKDAIARTAGAVLIVLGALVLFGLELPGLRIDAEPRRTITGSFVFGALFAVCWSGCVGPILGFALVLAAQTQTASQGGLLLVAYALGLVTPLLAVSSLLDGARAKNVLRSLRGRTVTIAGRAYHTTQLVSAIMLMLVGLVFLLRIDAVLAQSSGIGKLFAIEERIAAAFGITIAS